MLDEQDMCFIHKVFQLLKSDLEYISNDILYDLLVLLFNSCAFETEISCQLLIEYINLVRTKIGKRFVYKEKDLLHIVLLFRRIFHFSENNLLNVQYEQYSNNEFQDDPTKQDEISTEKKSYISRENHPEKFQEEQEEQEDQQKEFVKDLQDKKEKFSELEFEHNYNNNFNNKKVEEIPKIENVENAELKENDEKERYQSAKDYNENVNEELNELEEYEEFEELEDIGKNNILSNNLKTQNIKKKYKKKNKINNNNESEISLKERLTQREESRLVL